MNNNNTTQTQSATPKQLLAEFQNQQAEIVVSKRAELVIAIQDLKDLGGNDDYEASLQHVLELIGDQGVTLPILQEAFADQAALRKARESLIKKGELEESDGKPLLLKIKRGTTNPEGSIKQEGAVA